jgi:hypothetical protein
MQARKTELEIEKLMLEGKKLQLEVFWYPVAVASALIGSTIGATLLILKVIGAM